MTAAYPDQPPSIAATATGTLGVIAEVTTERLRQIEGEGYSPATDDVYVDRELARAAGAYALNAAGQQSGSLYFPWPQDRDWKPGDARRDLIKAAALCVAEVERLDRAAQAVGASS